MTITETLAAGTARLNMARIDSPGLDATLFLAETLGLSREQLILRGPGPLPETASRRFFQFIDRRIAGECTAYILGRKEFRGLDFLVNPGVLVPRPDTETLVEAALAELEVRRTVENTGSASGLFPPPPPASLLDLCTGSGAVAVALKHEWPALEVFAADISPEALETARLNAARLLGAVSEAPAGPEAPKIQPEFSNLSFVQSDLFDRISRRFHLITANPPYVESGSIDGLSPEVRREPRLALDGGADGLDLIRVIIAGAPEHLFPGGALLLEADPRQMSRIVSLLEQQGFLDIQSSRDLSGAERVIRGRTPGENPARIGGTHGSGAFRV
ncbi:MAG: peptide chain release factor N(5)-glutamine methyltransferase [Treponema sp.]|jgi:release factor glutamine methyltransferase|nr:peptide chain release factor N(5)-glutamine methyltransferase [Treponema sp.]